MRITGDTSRIQVAQVKTCVGSVQRKLLPSSNVFSYQRNGRNRSTLVASALNSTTTSFSDLLNTFLPSLNTKKGNIMKEILSIIATTERGTCTTQQDLDMLKDKFNQLEQLPPTEYGPALLNGTWKLLWTTEKEILFIIQEKGLASWCGTTAGEVYQVIDLENQRLQNCIEFPPEGSFVVDSSLQYGPDKCSFEFQGARLNLPGNRTVPLPPLGKSRFKTLFVSQKYRIALDDRGDYLIVERVAPPSTRY